MLVLQNGSEAFNPGVEPDNGDIMPQSIVRMFTNQEAANAALNELNERGFKAHAIEGEHAGIYSEYIQHGEVPVIVEDPPFGRAATATSILESHNPVKVDLPEVGGSQHSLTWDWYSPTPLSSILGWEVLSDDPTPLSSSLKQPLLTPEPVSSSPTLERIRKQSLNPAPFSSALGIPLLSENPGLLSAKFGWRFLLDDAAPLSKRYGWRVISDDPTPLSTKFRWRVLADNPTPLSSALGFKVLL